MIQLAKFSFGKDWVPVKYGKRPEFFNLAVVCVELSSSTHFCLADVEVDIPHELDLTQVRALGLGPGEELLPEGEAPSQQPHPKPGRHGDGFHGYKLLFFPASFLLQ